MTRIKMVPSSPSNYKYDVFISCKSEDYSYGKKVYDYLESKGIRAFLASQELRNLGDADYGKAIDTALDQSKHLVVVASSAKYTTEDFSPYVYYEWHTFAEEKKSGRKKGNILSIVAKDEIRDELPIGLRNYQSFLFDDYSDIIRYLKDDCDAPSINSKKGDKPLFDSKGRISLFFLDSTYESKIAKKGCVVSIIVLFAVLVILYTMGFIA